MKYKRWFPITQICSCTDSVSSFQAMLKVASGRRRKTYMFALCAPKRPLENKTFPITLRTFTSLGIILAECVQRLSNRETLCLYTATEIIKKMLTLPLLSGNLAIVNSCIQKVDLNLYQCLKCEKTGALRGNMVTHVENSHFPGNYPCEYCHKLFNSRNSLFVHIKRNHKCPEFPPY